MWLCVDKAGTKRHFVVQLVQARVGASPVNLRKSEVQITQGANHRNVRQAHVNAGTKSFVTQTTLHGLKGQVHFVHLPRDPGVAALGLGTPRPSGLQSRQNGGVEQAVGQGLPGFDFGAFATGGRDLFAHR